MKRAIKKTLVFVMVLTSLVSQVVLANQSTINDIIYAEKDLLAHVQLSSNKDLREKSVQKIQEMGFDIAGVDLKDNIMDLAIHQLEIPLIKSLNIDFNINWSKRYQKAISPEYKTSMEIEEILRTWSKDYPELVELFEVGKSFEGRTIWGVKITNSKLKNKYQSQKKPTVLFNGMHHAREIMSPEAVLDIGEYLLTNRTSEEVSKWLSEIEIYLVPMVNVDGNNKVWNGSTMWRKNTAHTYGVDLNRNYPYQWGKCKGSSGSTFSQTYRGPSVASESETQAMMALVAKIRPVFDISFHSYSELVIYPLGCRGQKVKNGAVSSIGQSLGMLAKYTAGTPWEILYSVDGDDIDWMYSEYNVIPFVLELNSRREGFQPDYKLWRDKTVKRIRTSWQFLLTKTLSKRVVKGKINALNLNLVRVQITRNNKMIENYKPHSDGSYFIVLNEGAYQLKVTRGREVLEERSLIIK